MPEQIQTDNYELSVNIDGDEESPVRFEFTPGLGEHCQMPHIESHKRFLAHELGCYVVSATAPGIFGSRLLDRKESIDYYSTYRTTDAEIELSQMLTKANNKQIAVCGGHSGGNRQAVYKGATLKHVKGVVSVFGALTWIRDNNENERKEIWPKRGFKIINVKSPDSDDLVEVVVPAVYTISAPAYDAIETVKAVKKPKLFIAGDHDRVALPSDIVKGYDISPAPKELKWVDCNHYYLSEVSADTQAGIEAELRKIFSEDIAKRKALEAVPNYSEPEYFDKVNELIADWMERHNLLPRQVGRKALQSY